jgi:chemotaxis protein MotB
MTQKAQIGGRPPRKKPNHERWMISYADLLTLLLALFVVLFASSTRNKTRMQEEARSLVEAFHGEIPAVLQMNGAETGILRHQPSPVPKPVEHPAPRVPHLPTVATRTAPPSPYAKPVHHAEVLAEHPAPPAPLVRPMETAPPPLPVPRLSLAVSQHLAAEALALQHVKEQLESLLQPLTSAHQVTIQATPLTLTISLDAAVLFDTGKAGLLPGAAKLLTRVSDSLKMLPQPFSIHLEGYTDNQPIDTAQFPSNWSLSVERAVSVVQLFADQGIDGSRLAAEGFSEFVPIAPNDTDAGRAKNRRVVIVIRAPDVQNPNAKTP